MSLRVKRASSHPLLPHPPSNPNYLSSAPFGGSYAPHALPNNPSCDSTRCPHCAQPVTLFRTRTPILFSDISRMYIRVCVCVCVCVYKPLNHELCLHRCSFFVFFHALSTFPSFGSSSLVSSDCQHRHRSHSRRAALHHADNASPPLCSLRVHTSH